jgi:hypothetical protein
VARVADTVQKGASLSRPSVVGRIARWSASITAALLLTAASASAAGTAASIDPIGKVNLRDLAAHARQVPYRPVLRNSAAQRQWRAREAAKHEGAPSALRTQLKPPNVPGLPTVADENTRGFEGLDIKDTVFTNGFEVEPPDQGLCGGKFEGVTYLFESVNLAIALYDTDTNQYTPALDLNSFFGQAPSVDPATGRSGPFLSDPKCYFDPDTGHWFHTVLKIDVDPVTGAFGTTSATLVAASATRDPFGPYVLYSIDATDRKGPGCPCFGDQPLLGADANGLFVSTAEYSIAGAEFNGAQIYAADKRALAAGGPADVVHLATGTTRTGTVQPATSPNGRYETAQQGTEYFMSSFECVPPDCHVDAGSLEDQITVWAVTHTSSLRTASPALRLLQTDLTSEVYGQPVPQRQKGGPHPLGQSLNEPVPEVEANDSRMNQVVFAGGRLWSGVNTIVTPGPRDGIAWFSLTPAVSAKSVSADIRRQGYLAATNAFLSFPSIGINDDGRGVVAYSVMGPKLYPSAGWTGIDKGGADATVRIARTGFRPEDGFTCYPDEPGGEAECRWGDYSASFALPNGDVWSATEFIGDNGRTTFGNWSTFIWPVKF